MSELTAFDLAQDRDGWEAGLDQTATLTRTPLVSDGAGGFTPGTVTTASYVCRVQPATLDPREGASGDRLTGTDVWDIQLPHTADVLPTDTIAVGATVYQVEGVTTGRSLNYGLSARCVRREGND